MRTLTDFERSVLDFERDSIGHSADKNAAIFRTFAVSPWRYVQFLELIIRKDAALTYDALLVRRLRRVAAGDPR